MPTSPSSSTRRTYGAIRAQLDELLSLARQPELATIRSTEVSQWSVGQQLEHLLLTDRMILDGFDGLLAGDLESAGGGPTAGSGVMVARRSSAAEHRPGSPIGTAQGPSQWLNEGRSGSGRRGVNTRSLSSKLWPRARRIFRLVSIRQFMPFSTL